MAAGEDQAQPIVLDALLVVRRRFVGDRFDFLSDVLDRSEAGAAPYAVDRLEASRRDEPGARIRRQAFPRPLLERGAKSVVQPLLGEIEVAQQTHERREDAARLRAIDLLYLRSD